MIASDSFKIRIKIIIETASPNNNYKKKYQRDFRVEIEN